MNKSYLKVALLAVACASMSLPNTSCKDYDDDINSLQSQINAVKASVEELKKVIEDGAVITSIEKTSDGILVKTTKGDYAITNGANGADGKDADVWTIGADGYWYLNGQKTDYRAIGEQGVKGDKGDKGDQGDKGDKGDQGDKGDKGDQGDKGDKGDQGDKGDKGDQGDKGDKGDQGDKGDKGDKGDTGEQGPAGPAGPTGPAGADGTNGSAGTGTQGEKGDAGDYYKPNPETGCFDLYSSDGKLIKHTDISYVAPGQLSAIYTGTSIIFSNVEGAENGRVEIQIGIPVGSLVFIPSVYDSVAPYATTDEPFYYLPSYLSETKTTTGGLFQAQNWNKSNVVALEYTINPNNAYIAENYGVTFVNRNVTSRAADDKSNLLVVESAKVLGSELIVTASINRLNLPTGAKDRAIVSARLRNGQDVVTSSDYVAVNATAVDARIYNKNAKPAPVYFYDRTKGIASASAETSAFIQQFVSLTAAANIEVLYTESLDLQSYVDLWCATAKKPLADVGFEGASYKFSYPTEYLANDAQKTNQQWFGMLDGTVFKANAENLKEGLTPAIGRTPVVRVDAFLPDNSGVEQMVATAYIKIKFVADKPQEDEDKDSKSIELGDKSYNYSALTANRILINNLDWQEVNNQIYGSQGLSATNFWNNYQSQYTVKVTTTSKTNSQVVLNPNNQTATVDQTFTGGTELTNAGISCLVNFTSGIDPTQTSNIEFFVNNLAKTDITYKDVDGKGAEYVITITLQPKNPKAYQPIVITQKFYVKDDFQPYTFNANFYNPATGNVQTKGEVAENGWAMQMNIAQAFTNVNGKDIFGYYADKTANIKFGNVMETPEIAFGFVGVHAGVDYTKPMVSLTEPLTGNKTVTMDYSIMLVNGEKKTNNFGVEFINPFAAGSTATVTLNANQIGTVTADAAKSVNVVEVGTTNAIYSYVGTALALSSKAKQTYKLTDEQVSVEYAWNKTKGDYAVFTDNLPSADQLKLDTASGAITYEASANLVVTRTLYINATVTFENLSKVVVEIPVVFKGQN